MEKMSGKLDRKLIKRINEVVRTQKYDDELVLTLLRMSNVARSLAEKMLLLKYKNETTNK